MNAMNAIVERLNEAAQELAGRKDVVLHQNYFGPPADPAAIAAAEEAIGQPFPDELRALYALHDGICIAWIGKHDPAYRRGLRKAKRPPKPYSEPELPNALWIPSLGVAFSKTLSWNYGINGETGAREIAGHMFKSSMQFAEQLRVFDSPRESYAAAFLTALPGWPVIFSHDHGSWGFHSAQTDLVDYLSHAVATWFAVEARNNRYLVELPADHRGTAWLEHIGNLDDVVPPAPPKWVKSKRAKATVEELLAHFDDPRPAVREAVSERLPHLDFDRRELIRFIREEPGTTDYHYWNRPVVKAAWAVLAASGEAGSEVVGHLIALAATRQVRIYGLQRLIPAVPPRKEWLVPFLRVSELSNMNVLETLRAIPDYRDLLAEVIRGTDRKAMNPALRAILSDVDELEWIGGAAWDALIALAEGPAEDRDSEVGNTVKTLAAIAVAALDSERATAFAEEIAKGLRDYDFEAVAAQAASHVQEAGFEDLRPAVLVRLSRAGILDVDSRVHETFALAQRVFRDHPDLLMALIRADDQSSFIGFEYDLSHKWRLSCLMVLAQLGVPLPDDVKDCAKTWKDVMYPVTWHENTQTLLAQIAAT